MANWWGAAKSLAGSVGDAADHVGRARDAFFDPNAMKAAAKDIGYQIAENVGRASSNVGRASSFVRRRSRRRK